MNGFIGCRLIFHLSNSSIMLMVSCSVTHLGVSLEWFILEFQKKMGYDINVRYLFTNFLLFDIIHDYFTVNYKQFKKYPFAFRVMTFRNF